MVYDVFCGQETAMKFFEPGQVWKEAAVRRPFHVRAS